MPEGPELHLASQFINSICKGRLFSGKVRKNPIHKGCEVEWDEPSYTITSASRGKELKVFLKTQAGGREDQDNKKKSKSGVNDEGRHLQILFNFGMSGKFDFTSANELPKHAHLSFFTEEPAMALSFVDPRRFGKWQVGADWSPDRGPCVMFEYPQFRSNVLLSLEDSAFNRPLCEALLNQKYFNGIGNYLRAEIIYRAGVRPFEQARSVLASLPSVQETQKAKVKSEPSDILLLCNLVPLEVIGLGTSLYTSEDSYSEDSEFVQWLRCYYKPGMKNIADHNKRTLWYHGDPGPLVPKEGKSRGMKRHSGTKDKGMTKKTKKEPHKEMDTAEESSKHKKRLRSSSARKTPAGSDVFQVAAPQTAKKGRAQRADKRKKTPSAQNLSSAETERKAKNGRAKESTNKKPRKALPSADLEVNSKKATQHHGKPQVVRSSRRLVKMEAVRGCQNDSRSDKKHSKKKL